MRSSSVRTKPGCAHLVYQVPGARAFEFHVELQGWELTPDPIESSGLVDRDGVTVTRDGVLVLPLAQASSRRAEITLDLRRSLRARRPTWSCRSRCRRPTPSPRPT